MSTIAKETSRSEAGQTLVVVALATSIFLVAFVGLATDYSSFWSQRQAVQGAADASCQAASMDLMLYSQGAQTANMNFTPGSGVVIDCASSPTAAPCIIAKYNGFDGTLASNKVQMSFPTSVAGATAPYGVTVPFVQVDVTTNAPAYFSRLLSGKSTVAVHAKAVCGMVTYMTGGGLLVLAPTGSGTYLSSGSTTVKIVGGGAVGVQVNSNNSQAVLISGSPTENLSLGGPKFTGSSWGVTGGPSSPITGFNGGTTGHWLAGNPPVPDPFAGTPVPSSVASQNPTNGTSGLQVPYGTDGCPDHTAQCVEFWPGYYPAGLTFSGYTTAIFRPGIYYMGGSITSSGGVTFRMATPAGHLQTDGLMFYFHSGTINMSAGVSSHVVDNVPSTALTCDGSTPPANLGIPASLTGNVLVAQCVTNGTYYDNGHDTTDSLGSVRGLVFYGDHANTSAPALSGSAALYFAGSMYFHSSSYGDTLTMSGTSATQAFWGSIVTDKIAVSGGSTIPLLLSSLSLPTSKVALLQ